MTTANPTGDLVTRAHPPYGERRTLECPRQHVAAVWWRASSFDPFEPIDGRDPDVTAGQPCPVCGLELEELVALIDGAPDEEVS